MCKGQEKKVERKCLEEETEEAAPRSGVRGEMKLDQEKTSFVLGINKWYHQELAQGQGISLNKWWQSSKATITHVFLFLTLSVGFDVKQQLLVTLLKLL